MESGGQQVRADVQRNREIVVRTAISVLSSNPEASMREIAEASGLGRTTVYRHFSSRDELVRAIFDQLTDEAVERFEDSLGAGGTATECLERLGPVVAELAAEYRFLQAHRDLDPSLADRKDPQDPLWTWIRKRHADGELNPAFSPEWQYRMIGAMARGASEELLAGRSTVEETGRVLGEMLARTFAAG